MPPVSKRERIAADHLTPTDGKSGMLIQRSIEPRTGTTDTHRYVSRLSPHAT
jgi:hypothetical protein